MRIEIEDLSPVEKKLTVTIPKESVLSEMDFGYKDLGKKVKVKGFRKGKVPRGILKRHYEKQVEEEVITKLVNDSYPKALKENKIVPVSQPTIDNGSVEEGKEFTYSAKFEVKPELEVKGYIGIEFHKKRLYVSEEDTDNKLSELQQSHAQLQELDDPRPIEAADFIVVDYQGFLGDEPIEGEEVSDHLVELGSGSFSPKFEEHFLGLKKGDEKSFEVILPEDYNNKDLAGKEATFKVKIKGIKEKIVSELNDDFAKDLGEYDTLNELREKIRENLENMERLRIESDVREKILDKLVEENSFEVPPSLVDQHLLYMINDMHMRLAFQGLTMEQVGHSFDSLKEQYKSQAEKEVKCSLLLEEIAKKESIEVDEKDIEDRVTEIADRAGQDIEKIRSHYNEKEARERLESGLLTEKTLDFIIQRAKIEEVEIG